MCSVHLLPPFVSQFSLASFAETGKYQCDAYHYALGKIHFLLDLYS